MVKASSSAPECPVPDRAFYPQKGTATAQIRAELKLSTEDESLLSALRIQLNLPSEPGHDPLLAGFVRFGLGLLARSGDGLAIPPGTDLEVALNAAMGPYQAGLTQAKELLAFTEKCVFEASALHKLVDRRSNNRPA